MFDWDSSYSIGIREIDVQHQNLFAKFKDLMSAMMEGKGKLEVAATLNFVNSYVEEHFSDEERIQLKYGYNKYNEQKAQHDAFRARMKEFGEKYDRDGATLSVVTGVQKEMSQWWKTHITTLDKDLGVYLKNNGHIG
jgi:hemerythrin